MFYYLYLIQIKQYTQDLIDQPVKNDLRTYDNIWKITTDEGDDYTTGYLLDYNYFNEYYEMISIDLSKQQAFDANPKAIQQINFIGNLNRKDNQDWNINDNTTMFFISNLQLNKLKSGVKNGTEVTLKLSLNIVSDSDDETNFRHKLLLTNTQVSRLCKAFANNSSANIKLSKTELSKIGQSGGFLSRLLGPLLKSGLSLMKNLLKSLAKSFLIPLALTAVASAIDGAFH